MNPNDYDDDGNNIVPCPICLSQYCPSKDGGKCQDEEDFIKSTININNKQSWEEEAKKQFKELKFKNMRHFGRNAETDMIFETSVIPLLIKREAEIRKEYEFDTNKSLEDKIDNIINNPPTWTDGNPKSQLERIMGVFNAELSKIRKETIEAVLDYIEENTDLCECSSKDRCEYRRKNRFQIRQSFKEKFNITI